MAEQSFMKRLKASGFTGNMTWRTLRALPLIKARGFHPSILMPMHAMSRPNATFLTDKHGSRTYKEFRNRICQIANALHGQGGAYHDGVIIMIPNSIAFLETLFACTTGGFTSVFVPGKSTPEEIEYLAENSDAKWIVADARYSDKLAEAKLPNIPDDHRFVVHSEGAESPYRALDELIRDASDRLPALPESKSIHSIAYTSGTTGKPKGAKRNMNKAGLPKVLNFLELVPFHGTDVHLVCCPLYHAAPMGTAQSHLVLGAKLVIQERFDPEEWLQLVEKNKVTTTAVVPTIIHDLLEVPDEVFKKYDVSSLRIMMTTGAPLTQAQRDRVRERFGEVLYDMYGSTEWGWLSVATPKDHRERPGTVGRTVPGVEVRVMDENRQPVGPGVTGELYARTELQIDEYHKNQDATDKASLDGFISVGDLVQQDEDGFLYIMDRKGDMVISGGVNLYPPEIEEALKSLPMVADAAVIGVPDERMGEKLLAYVVLEAGQEAAPEEIIEASRDKLASQKIPREIAFIEAIPRNHMGKIVKKELRDLFNSNPSA